MRPSRLLWAITLAATAATAHWAAQPDQPEWATRGKLHWCLHYSRATKPLVDLFAAHGQTLIHGGSFDSPETAAYAESKGLRYMPYVCSRTVTTIEIAKHPELKGAVLLNPDGSEFLAYGNPVRRYGSLFTTAWPEFVKWRTSQVMDRPDTTAVFYDNVYVNSDHRPEAIAAWQAWAKQHGIDPGDDFPPVRTSQASAPAELLLRDNLVAYYQSLKDYCRQHDPPLLTSPNLGSLPGYGMAIIESNAADLVFYETMSHAPFEHNTLRYKIGLAASHGRPTGILAYLPWKIAQQRGTKTWNEGMHHDFYPSSPLPAEFALGAAEGAACGGTYIPCYDLFPALPITALTDPFNQRIHRELQQSYDFLSANEPLYVGAQPGSEIGLLYSSLTTLHDRRAQGLEQVTTTLTEAGIPYEILSTTDLSDGLAGIKTLVSSNDLFADQGTADGVLRFAQGGGRVLLTGSFATLDPLGRPAQYPAAEQLVKPLKLDATPIRSWQLDGFEPEGPTHVKVVGGRGVASRTFTGPSGRYRAYLQVTDENDGTSTWQFSVGDRQVQSGKLDLEDNQQHWFAIQPFELKSGETLRLEVEADAGELGRVNALVLCAADSDAGATLGRGSVVYLPDTLASLSAAELTELLQPRIRVPEPAQVFVNLLDVPDQQLQTIQLVNYDFRYEVEQPGLFATDDGSGEARTYFSGRPNVVRKVLAIPHLDELRAPVLQVYCTATADCTAELVVTLNGQAAGRIPTKDARGWLELPLDKALLAVTNTIEVTAEGELSMDRWCQIGIDTDARTRGSEFSADGGQTFTTDDLSPDLKAQTGEYLIRIHDPNAGQTETAPDELLPNPGFEQVSTPHTETKLTVVPAEDLRVEVAGPPRAALAISPDGPPVWVQPQTKAGVTSYTVPEVRIYSVLVLGDRTRLTPLEQTQLRAKPWALPQVTTPLHQKLEAWQPYVDGFELSTEARSGRHCVTIQNDDPQGMKGIYQQLELDQTKPEPFTITAWSKSANVSGRADSGYSIYVDATAPDGQVYNGHAQPFEAGTHDWQQAALTIDAPMPLKTVKVYLLFRKHAGQVWFDDVSVRAGAR